MASKKKQKPIIKTDREISNIRESGKYLTELLRLVYDETQAGVGLLELEEFAQNYMDKNNVRGAFKGYQGFPANLCLSVNDCVVHGIPDDYILKNGDLIKIDCGVNYRGGISDSAVSKVVGGEMTNPQGFELIVATKNALDQSLKYLVPYRNLFDYSKSVFELMKKEGYSVIRNLTGHGVGNMVHEPPHIYNYPNAEMRKENLKPGMVIALEPITALTSIETVSKPINDRNLYTKKGDIGAQWEYTIVITEKGYEILSGVTEDLW